MPLFIEPDEPTGVAGLWSRLRGALGVWLGWMGWLTLAVGVVEGEGPLWSIPIGLACVLFGRRLWRLAAITELLALGVALSGSGGALGGLWLGAVMALVGRMLSLWIRW